VYFTFYFPFCFEVFQFCSLSSNAASKRLHFPSLQGRIIKYDVSLCRLAILIVILIYCLLNWEDCVGEKKFASDGRQEDLSD
jgi:hypothetical protein